MEGKFQREDHIFLYEPGCTVMVMPLLRLHMPTAPSRWDGAERLGGSRPSSCVIQQYSACAITVRAFAGSLFL